MIRFLSLLALLSVAACGVDGDPIAPDSPVYPDTTVAIGVDSDGDVGGAIGVRRGPLRVGVGVF